MKNSIGKRIQRARKGAGLSLRQLAERVPKSHTAISNYESGETTPNSTVLSQLADALDVRTEYFLRSTEVQLGDIGFRTHEKLPAKQQERITAVVSEKAERYFELLELYPQVPIGDFKLPETLPEKVEAYEQIEQISETIRRAWDIGFNPIADLIDELEAQGILVLTIPLSSTGGFDGLSATVNGYPLIVLGDDWPGDRQRFTAAHELGHLVLNDRLVDELDIEDACNRFAGAFLVPQPAAETHLGTQRKQLEPRELYALKHEFGLSMRAWVHRAEELGIINEATCDKLLNLFGERGWLETEPGEPIACETPHHFEQYVYHGLAEGLFGESKAAELLGKSLTVFRRERMMEDVSHVPAGE